VDLLGNYRAKWSVILVVSLLLGLAAPVVPGFAAEYEPVVETDTHILIRQDHYHVEIEKNGFKYAFIKPDGTVIADRHGVSGIRFTAPGGDALSDAVSTELLSHDASVVRMQVTNGLGVKALVNVHLFDHYVKFEIIPEHEADDPGPNSGNLLNQKDAAGEAFITAGEESWTDYTFEAAMQAGNQQPGSSASGIVFRYQDDNNFYHLRLHHGNGEIQLLKKKDGAFTVLDKRSVPLAANQWYSLKAEVEGSVITVYLDGVEQFSCTDAADAFVSGAVGMRTYKDQVSFKNIAVRADGETLFEDTFEDGVLDGWNIRSGSWSVSEEAADNTYIIDARTAPLNPAYGLGDYGRNGQSTNVYGFSSNDMTNKGGEERFISNFTIFPAHGFAQVLFEEGRKRVTINGSENKLGAAGVADVKHLYYFTGDMKQIYKDYQTVRHAEGYPDYLPKYNFFEVGYEAFGSLGWNTYQSSVTEDLQTYLSKGYDLKWAVVGSGFWKGDRSNPNEGATTSFGIWDDEPDAAPRGDGLPNPRYPDVDGFKRFLRDNGLKFFLGLRVNFKAPAEEGGYHYLPHDGLYTYEGIDNGYFLKDENGAPRKFSVNFPKGNVYLLDTRNGEALDWYVNGAGLWGVDGFKEDTMMISRLYQDGLWNRSNARLMEEGYYVMVRNAAYSIPGDIIRLEDTMHGFNQDRPVINALNYAASGAPNVYADIIAGKYLTTPLTEDQKRYFVRNAMFGALTPAISVGLGPWKMENPEYEAAVKKAVDFHSMYAPYIYSAAVDSYHTGFPHTMTPLPIAFPDDPNTYNLANRTTRQYEWMIGPSMLAAPAYGEDYASVTSRDVYLPAGKWIDFETGTVYEGPVVLENYELPIDKIPVFIGGKGVIVSRELHGTQLFAEVFPIAASGSSYTFTHPDGTSTSVIRNDNAGWNPDTLVITDTTAGEEVAFVYDAVRKSFKFEIAAGHDYVLTNGEYEKILQQVDLTVGKQAELLVGERTALSVEGRLMGDIAADLTTADIRYESDNEAAVLVDDSGRVTAIGTGTANVRAIVTLDGVTVESNVLALKVVEPEIGFDAALPGAEFASLPVIISGHSSGFEQVELRINGRVIPVEASVDGAWQAEVNQLPDGAYGVQVIGRDLSGKIRAAETADILVRVDGVLYDTDFAGDNAEWQVANGTWTVRADGGETAYGASGSGLTYAGDPAWGDYVVEARVITHTPNASQGGGAGGIVFRYKDSGNFYHFRMDHLIRPSEGIDVKTAQLYKWENGSAVKLAEVPFDYAYDVWYDVKAVVEGDSIKAYIDGVLVLEANDDSIRQGAVGFRTNGRSFAASRIAVTSIPVDSETKVPTWLHGGLVASEIGKDQVKLNWFGAADREAVTDYRIDRDGMPGAPMAAETLTVTGSVYGYTVTGLTPDTTYVFKVEAGNGDGQWSTDGPIVTVTTLPADDPGGTDPGGPDDPGNPAEPGKPDDSADTTAPIWTEGFLTVSNRGTTHMTWSWRGASDDTGVTAYRIDRNGVPGEPIAADALTEAGGWNSFTVTGLTPGTTYVFKVEAGDAAGNWSTDGPAVTAATRAVSTPPTPPADATEEPEDNAEPEEPADGETAEPVRMEPLEDTEAAPIVGKGIGDNADVRPASRVYRVTFTEGGASVDGTAEPAPVRITLAYDGDGVDETLLGVYRFNEETGLWEYVGGDLDRESGLISADVTREGLYAVMEYDMTFEDVPADHWAHTALKQLAARHIVKGVGENAFAPASRATRAEFAALLARALRLSAGDEPAPFTDVAADAWYAKELAAAHAAGLVNGLTIGSFAPDEPVSREQMAAMLARAYAYRKGEPHVPSGDQLDGYADGADVSGWARYTVNAVIELGLMRGKDADRFAPLDEATRAETAMVIWNLLSKFD